MIIVQEIKNTDGVVNSFKVALFSDTRDEVTPSATIEGLPEGATIEMGSTCLTASGELGFMKSNGEWNWV
jgi:hypothetical protein